MFAGSGTMLDPTGVCRAEPAKQFRFAVTWTSLTAHLRPCEAQDRGLVPQVVAPTLVPSDARWEMVVPKMVRMSPKVAVVAMIGNPPERGPSREKSLSRIFKALGKRSEK